ncbi:MAG TPA: YbhB/YbcL family Raf kinase inhibitor-like protein [Candidatus Paceibacterota bacterium]
MRIIFVVALAAILIFVVWFSWFVYQPAMIDKIDNLNQQNKQSTMKLESTAFLHSQLIPLPHTCDGPDVSPPLRISEIPRDAKSIALIMDDPDAIKPAGKVWDHWVIFNIPVPESGVLEIFENSEPNGIHGVGTSKNTGYHGPCPPDGEHRYFFKTYALDTMLGLAEGATKAEVERAMEGHIVDHTELMGKYSRKR